MTSDAVLRWMRALTLPSALFFSALAGHAAGGGAAPSGSVLVPLFVLTVAAVAPFARSPIRPAAVVALIIGGQGVLHAAFQLLSGTAGTATTVMCGADLGGAAVSSPSGCHVMTHPSAASHGLATPLINGGHIAMLLGHLAAAVVLGVWLAAGERALLMVLVLAVRPVVAAWRTVTALVRDGAGSMIGSYLRLQLGWDLPCAARRLVWAAGAVSRRGPPGASAA